MRAMLHASSMTPAAPAVVSQPGDVHRTGHLHASHAAAVTLLVVAILVCPGLAANAQTAGIATSAKAEQNPHIWISLVSGVLWLIVAALTLFMTRREIERAHADHDRRMQALEDRQEEIEHRCEAIATEARNKSAEVYAKLMGEVGDLHEKINKVHLGLASVESEVRVNGKTTDAIARKLNVLPG